MQSEEHHRRRSGRPPASAERRGIVVAGSSVFLLHLLGWGALFTLVLPAQTELGGSTGALLALAVSAYALGIRHAFDADHIAAIDNATRKLLADGRPSSSSGFWFALGHSSIVLIAVLLLALGLESFTGGLADEDSVLRHTAGIWGGTISGLFLITVGALNLVPLISLNRMRRTMRTTAIDDADLSFQLNSRGALHRLLRPIHGILDRPSKMYLVGLLFGLGLDTAASISLFVLAGSIASGLPWYTVMVLPVLFTAGMTLFDSADGILMSRLYQWAVTDNRRTVHLNIITTAVSVIVAFLVGGVGLLSVFHDLSPRGAGIVNGVSALELDFLGIALVLFFGCTFLIALVWRKTRQSSSV